MLCKQNVSEQFDQVLGSRTQERRPPSRTSEERVKAMIAEVKRDLCLDIGLPNVKRPLCVNFEVSQIAKEYVLMVPTEDINSQVDLARSELQRLEFDEAEERDRIESLLECALVINKLKGASMILSSFQHRIIPPSTLMLSLQSRSLLIRSRSPSKRERRGCEQVRRIEIGAVYGTHLIDDAFRTNSA